ncbi:aldehyde dehydrogenase family protein, partial [Acinetobacter variabilis]
WLDKAVKKGAKVLSGGKLDGVMFEPTLLEDVDHELEVYKDEVFGPMAILEKYSNFEAGIECINSSRFGLQAGVYTQ